MQGGRTPTRLGRTWARIGIVVALVTPGALAGTAAAEDLRTAALTPGTEILREADPPAVLANGEAARYARLFALQTAADWPAADHEIEALRDKLLIGHVLAQRYLHKSYKAGYQELADWLEGHADEPDAKAIHALAVKRRPAGTKAPTRPVVAALLPRAAEDDVPDPRPVGAVADARQLTAVERRRTGVLKAEIRALARDEPRKAELLLAGVEAKQLLSDAEYDELRTAVAEAYLDTGEAQQALILSATTRSPAYAPVAHWNAGLAAWRLGRLGEARMHFQALARSPGQTNWTISAAAFWAARTELRGHRPELVNYWLGIAAEHPRTFYGLLARCMLGVDTYLNFDAEPFTELDARILAGAPAGRRALALLQVGERARAEGELRGLAPHASASLLQSLAALTDRANMPALSLQLAGVLADGDGRNHDHALFPVPRWEPRGGYTIVRALLFALMRQESLFLPHVESSAGAVGLMQLMPATARSMAERTGVPLRAQGKRQEHAALVDPELNMALAQEFLSMLLKDERTKGNLMLVAAAYNGGLGAVMRWQSARAEYRADPLLFLESIPSHETRIFTQRVLTNYWIYRRRLSQPAPDLDALAAGQWPTYTALDSTTEQDGRYAAHR